MFLFNGIHKEPDNNTSINDGGDNNFLNNFFKINLKKKRKASAYTQIFKRIICNGDSYPTTTTCFTINKTFKIRVAIAFVMYTIKYQ